MRDAEIAHHDGNVWGDRDAREARHARTPQPAARRSDSVIGASEQDPAVPPPRDLRRVTVLPEESRTRVTRGPLLAVCGLCGGAGASTLAYLVALAESRGAEPPNALVADTGGPGGGIACYAGVESPRSLVEVVTNVAAGLPAGQLVATTEAGVRVLATGPRFTPECARAGLKLVLEQARERYALTAIDCGTLAREADQVALAKASHVAWVLLASTSGVRRARPVLEAIKPLPAGP